MVTNNKILTVSYGTFSCTLEGFDDSFDTMKAIAEYFRDLAADDRYFGAEPPQPDAEMLARIAQREVARRVEAHEEEGGIHLRAATPALTAGTEDAAYPSNADLDPGAEEDAAKDTPPPAEETAPEPEAVEEQPVIEAAKDAISEKVPEVSDQADAELAALISATAGTAAKAEPVAEVEVAVVEDPPEAETSADETVAEDTDPSEDETPSALDEAAEDAALDTTEPPAEIAAEPVEAEAEAPAPDSIAAKLQRIRAVVARKGTESAEEEYSEDQHAEIFVAEAAKDIETALQVDEEADAEEADDVVHDVLARFDAEAAEEAAEAEPEKAVVEDAPKAELDIPAWDDDDEEESDEDDAVLFGDLDGEDDEDDIHENILGEETGETVPAQGQVFKVKRAALDRAVADGLLEEVEDDEDQDDAAPDEASSLSDEDEADLMRELAEVEAEIQAERSEDDTPDTDADTPRKTLAPSLDDEDANVSRLMSAAGDKMDDPETASNRDSYSHMRAAVATTRAKIEAGENPDADASDAAYREDLASVVRPRRPESSGAGRARPTSRQKPAPLKLVAEQRIDDVAKPEPRGPVRPRRVAMVEEEADTGGDSAGFAAFAAEAGAVDLPDLLEAAAAYMSFVEGKEQFSRPQLMSRVRQGGLPEFNREDGLRSFGQLLREGKIQKTGGGRFTASEEIGFRPGSRAAG